jgi:Immunoglobulin domain
MILSRILPPAAAILIAAGTRVSAQAPVVTTQPAGIAIIKGAPIVLTAAGSGTPAPAFQWYRNNTAIPGATAATLNIPASTIPDDGSYFVRLTNTLGTTDSNTVTVSVLYPGEGLRHRYAFTGNLNDSLGTAHAQLWAGTAQVGSPSVGATSLTLVQGSSHHLRLPPAGAGTAGLNVNTYTQLTVETWCSIAEHNGKLKLWPSWW